MSSIRSRDIACAEGPDIRCLEHFLKLLDLINNAFHVHSGQYSEPALQPNRATANALGKAAVINVAGHKIRQNAGPLLGIDIPGSSGSCCSETICSADYDEFKSGKHVGRSL